MGYHKQLWIDATPADLRDRAAAERHSRTKRSVTVTLTEREARVVAMALSSWDGWDTLKGETVPLSDEMAVRSILQQIRKEL